MSQSGERTAYAHPGIIGDITRESGAKILVLSHFMARSLRNLDRNLEVVRSSYSGPVLVAHDLQYILLTP